MACLPYSYRDFWRWCIALESRMVAPNVELLFHCFVCLSVTVKRIAKASYIYVFQVPRTRWYHS